LDCRLVGELVPAECLGAAWLADRGDRRGRLIVGGIVYSLVNGSDYSPAGFVFSTVGAVCCLVAYRWYTSTGGSL
jgi:hypothetical protein